MPKTNLSKIFKLVVTLFFLLCLLRPLVSFRGDISFSWSEYVPQNSGEMAAQVEELSADYAYKQASENIKKMIEDKCRSLSVIPAGIEVTVGQNAETEELDLAVKLTLEQKDQDKAHRVAELLQRELGLKATIVIKQEE